MSLMQPDMDAEFRREKEYRAKVYNLLSMGLSTTEIENLLQKHVDWSQFSLDTLETLTDLKKPLVAMEFPESFQSKISNLMETYFSNHKEINSKLSLIENKLNFINSKLIFVEILIFTLIFTIFIIKVCF